MAAILKKTAAQEKRMRRARAFLVSGWMITNFVFAAVFVGLNITRQYVPLRCTRLRVACLP